MKKDKDKKPGKATNKAPEKSKSKEELAMDDFLENKALSRARLDEDRAKAKKLAGAKQFQEKIAPIKKNVEEKPVDLKRDLKTRNLVDQFYGGEEPAEEEVEENPFYAAPEDVVEKNPFNEALEEISGENLADKYKEVASKVESVEVADDVREALLSSMKNRGAVSEQKTLSPKDQAKAEKVDMAINAAQNLYTGTRRVTRDTLDFAGDLAKGSIGVVAGVAGGVLSLAGKSVLGLAAVAGIGYRGVGAVVGIVKGDVKRPSINLSPSAITSGIAKKTSDFLCIEGSNKVEGRDKAED